MNRFLIKIQTVTAIVTTLGVWSNFLINYKFKEKFVTGEIDNYGSKKQVNCSDKDKNNT